MDKELKRQLDRIDTKLTTLLGKAPKETWVKVSWIQDVTGWNREKMREARAQGIIKYRKGENGIEYLLESVPEIFIIKKAV